MDGSFGARSAFYKTNPAGLPSGPGSRRECRRLWRDADLVDIRLSRQNWRCRPRAYAERRPPRRAAEPWDFGLAKLGHKNILLSENNRPEPLVRDGLHQNGLSHLRFKNHTSSNDCARRVFSKQRSAG